MVDGYTVKQPYEIGATIYVPIDIILDWIDEGHISKENVDKYMLGEDDKLKFISNNI